MNKGTKAVNRRRDHLKELVRIELAKPLRECTWAGLAWEVKLVVDSLEEHEIDELFDIIYGAREKKGS